MIALHLISTSPTRSALRLGRSWLECAIRWEMLRRDKRRARG